MNLETPRKTRIVCTLGPAVSSRDAIIGLIRAGMNVARFNFSHGDHAEHRERLVLLRQAAEECGAHVATMLDTKGPEIRTGRIRNDEKVELIAGNPIILTTEEIDGDSGRVGISYQRLPQEVSPGGHIFVADGLMDLEVERVDGNEIHCRVVSGGMLGSRKNVNVPGVRTSLPAMTDKDSNDIRFAIDNEMDFVAASFVRKADDVRSIREYIDSFSSPIMLLSKIEDQEGLDNIDDIIRVSDGIMVARGDLGVQLELEEIPMAQKRIIEKCNRENRPVITATQMLDSMIANPKPTRAELTDVANAIFDGTDAVMLSGETANGAYPIRATETLSRIALAVETSPEYRARCENIFSVHGPSHDIGHSVAKAAIAVANEVGATAIVTPSLRGNSPRLLSKFRPAQKIIAVTTSERVCRQLMLTWGVIPLPTGHVSESELMIQNALRIAMEHGVINRLDKVVTAAGIPLNSPLMLNTIKVHFMGNILSRGHYGFGETCSGRILKTNSAKTEGRLINSGAAPPILLVHQLSEADLPLVPHARGIICEHALEVSPEAVRAVNESIVVISEVPEAFEKFEDGAFVSLNGSEMIIYEGLLPDSR